MSVTQVTRWQDSSGSLHETKAAAERADRYRALYDELEKVTYDKYCDPDALKAITIHLIDKEPTEPKDILKSYIERFGFDGLMYLVTLAAKDANADPEILDYLDQSQKKIDEHLNFGSC